MAQKTPVFLYKDEWSKLVAIDKRSTVARRADMVRADGVSRLTKADRAKLSALLAKADKLADPQLTTEQAIELSDESTLVKVVEEYY